MLDVSIDIVPPSSTNSVSNAVNAQLPARKNGKQDEDTNDDEELRHGVELTLMRSTDVLLTSLWTSSTSLLLSGTKPIDDGDDGVNSHDAARALADGSEGINETEKRQYLLLDALSSFSTASLLEWNNFELIAHCGLTASVRYTTCGQSLFAQIMLESHLPRGYQAQLSSRALSWRGNVRVLHPPNMQNDVRC